VVAGTKAQGRRSVAIWLARSAVSMYLASNQLHLSPLVQSLPMRTLTIVLLLQVLTVRTVALISLTNMTCAT